MSSILPVISMTDLQRDAKKKFQELVDYAVIQRHGKDVAFVLHPRLGKLLLEMGLLEILKKNAALAEEKKTTETPASPSNTHADVEQLDALIGQVIRELSRK